MTASPVMHSYIRAAAFTLIVRPLLCTLQPLTLTATVHLLFLLCRAAVVAMSLRAIVINI